MFYANAWSIWGSEIKIEPGAIVQGFNHCNEHEWYTHNSNACQAIKRHANEREPNQWIQCSCIRWEGKMSWIIIFAWNSVSNSQTQHKCGKKHTHSHTYEIKPYPCLFINTPRIFAYNLYSFQSSCGLLFHKVYVWFTHPPRTLRSTNRHGNIALISTNKQANIRPTMSIQSLWLNEQWQNNTQQKCCKAITPKNQSMPSAKIGRICFRLWILICLNLSSSKMCIKIQNRNVANIIENRLINWSMCAFINMISMKCRTSNFQMDTAQCMTCKIANNQSRFNVQTLPNFHTTDLYSSSSRLLVRIGSFVNVMWSAK